MADDKEEREVQIRTTWDGQNLTHKPVEIELKRLNESSFIMEVKAIFFDDPKNPGGVVGQPFHGLWEYEGILKNITTQFIFNKTWQEMMICYLYNY